MADFDDLVLDDNGFQTRGSRQLLWDVWFVARSKTGLGKLLNAIADRVGSRQIPLYDASGKQVGTTSKDAEASWNKTNFARLSGQIAGVTEAVKQLATAQGVADKINLDAITQAAKDGAAQAMAEGVVKVDVAVQGTTPAPTQAAS